MYHWDGNYVVDISATTPKVNSLIATPATEMWRVEADGHFSSSHHFYRERQDPLQDYSDDEFVQRYRISREDFMEILDIIGPILERPTRR